MEWLQQATLIAAASTSQQSMPRKQSPSAALGGLPAGNYLEDPLRPEGADATTSGLMVTLTSMIPIMMQISQNLPIPTGASSCILATLWPLQPTLPMLSHHFLTQPQALAKDGPTGFPDGVLQLQREMNVVMEQLLAKRATMDFQCRELELNAELTACLNDAQAAEAIKEAEVCHQNTTCALQQAHQDNVLALECEAKVTEAQDHQPSVRWVYQKTHQANFKQEGSYDLSSVFCQMATSTNLLDTEVYEVQESWGSQRDLKTTNQVASTLPKDIHFLQIASPMESPKTMGLKGIHSTEALQCRGGLTFCPWCGKEGQNEGMLVNHLGTMHYQLGLICAHCLSYFITNAEAMHCHGHGCKPTTAGTGNDDDYAKYEDDENGDEDDKFMLKED